MRVGVGGGVMVTVDVGCEEGVLVGVRVRVGVGGGVIVRVTESVGDLVSVSDVLRLSERA